MGAPGRSLPAAKNANSGRGNRHAPRAHRFVHAAVDGLGTITTAGVERPCHAAARRRSIALGLFDVVHSTLVREGNELVFGGKSFSSEAESAVHVLPTSINCDTRVGSKVSGVHDSAHAKKSNQSLGISAVLHEVMSCRVGAAISPEVVAGVRWYFTSPSAIIIGVLLGLTVFSYIRLLRVVIRDDTNEERT